MAEKITIAVVDDHTLFRKGISALLREMDELNILFEAGNGQEMQLALTKEPAPQVVLMDVNMPVMDGYAATSWLKGHYPEVRVLALSMFEDDQPVIRMIRAGACGYLLKESSPRELLEAIRIVVTRGIYINEYVSGKLVRSISTADPEITISARETEFMKLCCSELTYKEIADKLFVSPRTIDGYREALFQKLEIKSRTGLVLYAIQKGVVRV